MAPTNPDKLRAMKYAWVPHPITLWNREQERNPESLRKVLDQFDHVNASRYQRDPSSGWTKCNILVWDFTSAMSCEVPHWTDRTGLPREPGGPGAMETTANILHGWFPNFGTQQGWRGCMEEEAQAAANKGSVSVAIWRNQDGPGHVAALIPRPTVEELVDVARKAAKEVHDLHRVMAEAGKGTWIAQAGGKNFRHGLLMEGFGAHAPAFWTHA